MIMKKNIETMNDTKINYQNSLLMKPEVPLILNTNKNIPNTSYPISG